MEVTLPGRSIEDESGVDATKQPVWPEPGYAVPTSVRSAVSRSSHGAGRPQTAQHPVQADG